MIKLAIDYSLQKMEEKLSLFREAINPESTSYNPKRARDLYLEFLDIHASNNYQTLCIIESLTSTIQASCQSNSAEDIVLTQ